MGTARVADYALEHPTPACARHDKMVELVERMMTADGLRLAETLLVQDKDLSAKGHPVYIINPKYDDKMLIRAICKVEGFRYRNEGRLHGVSSENRFLHVTTQLLTQAYLDSLVSDIRLEQSLLVYCTRRSRNLVVPDNVEVKKIPRDLLSKCDYAEDVK